MAVLHFEYSMKIDYEKPVSKCYFTIKCIPKEDARQHLLKMDISLVPKIKYSLGEDSFGNRQIYGSVEEEHSNFIFGISGDVKIVQTDYEEKVCEERIGMYRFPFGKCVWGSGLLSYYNSLDFSGCKNNYDICVHMMNQLHQDFSYVPKSTHIQTTAEEAWNLGKGVCQDYAHIYISLLRMANIPARYVCGLIIGEGVSHAWVEALCDNRWIAFDPTNNCLVLNHYIKLGDGRDALDCAINRGIMWGGGAQTQKISVTVEESNG